MLQDSLASFFQARADTFALLQDLSQQQLDYKPSPGKWSIGEVMDHLSLAERLFRSQIQLLIFATAAVFCHHHLWLVRPFRNPQHRTAKALL